MTITITQNETFGQLYVESSDDPTENIRIPTANVDDFLHATGIDEEFPLTYGGDLAQSIWIVAQNFEG
jgi:hypothetical protein